MMLFKRKKKTVEEQSAPQPEIDTKQITQEIDALLPQLDKAEGEDRINVLNKLGSLYFEMNEFNKSIEYYEISISEKKVLGKAYTDLVKLYNIKRKEASAQKDSENVQLYLNKSDELMKLTKDTIRGRV
jgi:uncharacterized protein HemY